MFVLIKAPDEVVPCTIDFEDVLPEGEMIDGATVTVTDASAVDKSTTMIEGTPSSNTTEVSATVTGGTDGKYLITAAITTTSGYEFEEFVRLIVRTPTL